MKIDRYTIGGQM